MGTAISVGDGASAEALSKAGTGFSNIFQKGGFKHVEAEKEAYVTFSLFRTVD